MGRLDEAYEKAQASLAMRQKVLSSEHPDLAHSLAGKMTAASVMLIAVTLDVACPCKSVLVCSELLT
jgi:hypothetical protein